LPATELKIRSLSELDVGDIVRIAELTRRSYQPDLWEDRVTYYLRRDPEGSVVAESGGKVVGFMLGDVRSGAAPDRRDPRPGLDRVRLDPAAPAHPGPRPGRAGAVLVLRMMAEELRHGYQMLHLLSRTTGAGHRPVGDDMVEEILRCAPARTCSAPSTSTSTPSSTTSSSAP
jgi:ribosomal protein S18 acetylase RimI-like enzyme